MLIPSTKNNGINFPTVDLNLDGSEGKMVSHSAAPLFPAKPIYLLVITKTQNKLLSVNSGSNRKTDEISISGKKHW